MTKQLYSPACGRGTGKRTRDSRDIDDTEEWRCLPLAKQTKISESESTKDIFNIPVSNSFTLLAEMNDEEPSVKEPFDNLPTKPSSNNNTGIHSNVCTRARESCIDEILFEHSTTLDLVARTVDYIFKYIKDIRGSLEKIISLVSLTGKDSSPDVPPEMKPLQMPRAPVLPHTSCIIPQAAGNQKSEQDQATQAQVVPALTTFDLQPGCAQPRDVKSGQDTVEDSTTLWSNSEAVARLDALLEANRKGCLPPALHCMFPTASADPKGPPPSILEHTLNVESMDLSLSDTPVHQNPSLQLPIIKPQSMAAAAVSGARKLPGKQATITSFFQPIVPPRRMHSQVDSAVLVPQGPA
ncbi:Hypothetical predicted protein [Podarcis lilfordi]|uniref:Uncharacterized protein n=1 Tax=Podarcis lilfordi TaxID=74358 RepID=A0AA35KNX8_9SAUR|nr:Hypothetical predicted protein [Podarcis lilfordi]